MKARDSGMPEREYWERLFDVPLILDALKIDESIGDAVEIGCGYGTFTLPVANRIAGVLHSFDIEAAMIAETRARIDQSRVQNVMLYERDVFTAELPLARGSVNAVLLFNILHAENPIELLRISADLLRPDGRVLAIHWRSDVKTPRGPALSIRPRPEQIRDWAVRTGLLSAEDMGCLLPPWHFGVTLARKG